MTTTFHEGPPCPACEAEDTIIYTEPHNIDRETELHLFCFGCFKKTAYCVLPNDVWILLEDTEEA